MLPRCKILSIIFAAACLAAPSPSHADTVGYRFKVQSSELRTMPVGKRIAYWAESFVGTPYDTDPLGKYVRKERIIADDAVDCMYLTFRAVELAVSREPEDAAEKALDLRFITKGRMDGDKVVNYDDRFQYGEDMIDSGKWGKEITSELGRTEKIKGSRGREEVVITPRDELLKTITGTVPDLRTKQSGVVESGLSPLQEPPLQNGDIIFFIKAPSSRVVGEIVGHIGIVTVKESVPYLIHASGTKKSDASPGGGSVKSVMLSGYIEKMKFIGVRVTRFK